MLKTGEENAVSHVSKWIIYTGCLPLLANVQVMPIVSAYLVDSSNRLPSTCLCYEFSSLHAYLVQKALSSEFGPSCQGSLQLLWQQLLSIGLEMTASSAPDAASMGRLTGLLRDLHQPPATPRSRTKVTIFSQDDGPLLRPGKQAPCLKTCSSSLELLPDLMCHSVSICSEIVRRAISSPGSRDSLVYVDAAARFLGAVCSDMFLGELLKKLGVQGNTDGSAANAFLRYLQPLVRDTTCVTDVLSERYYSHVVDCLLTVSFCARDQEVVQFLNKSLLVSTVFLYIGGCTDAAVQCHTSF